MAGLLYFAVAGLSVAIANRLLLRMSWPARIAIILIPLCFTGKALLTGRVYAPIDLPFSGEPLHSMAASFGIKEAHNGMLSDVYCLNIPWKYAVRAAYANGEWPLWSPFNFCGDVLAASAQPTPYEPYFLLSLLLPMATSLTYLAAITFFLAALLMFVLLREIGCREESSLIGAAAWTFCFFLVFWLEWVITPSTLWLPLVLVGVRRVVREGSLHATALLTFAFVMMLLNGHPESALHIVTLGIVWAIAEIWTVRGRGVLKAIPLGIGAGVVALLLCAMYMLPILEAIPQTMEHGFRAMIYAYARKSAPTKTALEHLLVNFIPFRFGDPSVHDAWPHETPFGYPENSYCGSLALALALFGLWRSRWRGKWLALAFIVAGLLIGNEFAPFGDVLGSLPLYDIALNSRLIFAASFGMAMLVALGVDILLGEGRLREVAAFAIATAAFLGVACAYLWRPMQVWGLPRSFVVHRTAMFIVPLVILAIVAAAQRSRLVVCASILLLLLVQRTAEMGAFYPALSAEIFYPPIPMLDRLPKSREPYRVVGLGGIFFPNMSKIYELEDVRGYQAMTLSSLRETYSLWSVEQPVWWNRVDDLRPFLSMMNVRYAIARTDAIPPEGWVKIAEQSGSQVFENQRVLPRAFVPRKIRTTSDRFTDLGEMAEATDFRETGWIFLPNATPNDATNGPGRVASERRGYGGLIMHTVMEGAGWVIVSEAAWKGWRAYVDGRPTELRHANHAFLGVLVPAGEHTIRLLYLPHSFVVGRAITISTIALLVVLAILIRLASRDGQPGKT